MSFHHEAESCNSASLLMCFPKWDKISRTARVSTYIQVLGMFEFPSQFPDIYIILWAWRVENRCIVEKCMG